MENTDSSLELRVQELEIKLSYMEKELNEYKGVSDQFYKKLEDLESTLKHLERRQDPFDPLA